MSLSTVSKEKKTPPLSLGSALDLPGAADRFAELRQYTEKIAESFPSHLGGCLLFVTKDRSAFEPAAEWNLSDESQRHVRSIELNSFHAQLICQGEELYLNGGTPSKKHPLRALRRGQYSLASIPLVVNNAVIGCIYAVADSPAFDLDDKAWLFQLKEVAEQFFAVA